MSRLLKVGASLAVGCFGALLVLGVVRPYGVLDHEAPMTDTRRVIAGIMLLLNIGTYIGIGICSFVGIRAVVARLRRRSADSVPSS